VISDRPDVTSQPAQAAPQRRNAGSSLVIIGRQNNVPPQGQTHFTRPVTRDTSREQEIRSSANSEGQGVVASAPQPQIQRPAVTRSWSPPPQVQRPDNSRFNQRFENRPDNRPSAPTVVNRQPANRAPAFVQPATPRPAPQQVAPAPRSAPVTVAPRPHQVQSQPAVSPRAEPARPSAPANSGRSGGQGRSNDDGGGRRR
jgi:hypothetical protein